MQRHVCTSPTANSASTASHQTLGFPPQRKPCHHKAKRDEQTPRRQEFDAVIAHRPAHPRCSRRGEGDAEEDHGVECRGERRRDQRRPPPAYPSKAVEDGNVCELPHKEGRTRGRGDPGRSDDGGESDRQRKSHVDYTSGGLCTESPVGEVGDQESERVREGTFCRRTDSRYRVPRPGRCGHSTHGRDGCRQKRTLRELGVLVFRSPWRPERVGLRPNAPHGSGIGVRTQERGAGERVRASLAERTQRSAPRPAVSWRSPNRPERRSGQPLYPAASSNVRSSAR